jgi:hypothetical protein
MALSQDQAKITVQILNSLRYTPDDGKTICGIVDELNKLIVDKTLDVPSVSLLPENINVKIEKKAK